MRYWTKLRVVVNALRKSTKAWVYEQPRIWNGFIEFDASA